VTRKESHGEEDRKGWEALRPVTGFARRKRKTRSRRRGKLRAASYEIRANETFEEISLEKKVKVEKEGLLKEAFHKGRSTKEKKKKKKKKKWKNIGRGRATIRILSLGRGDLRKRIRS